MGRITETLMMFPMIFSSGCPFFSYIANRKKGSATIIISMVAALEPAESFSRKNTGTATAMAAPKQMSCLLVRLNMTLVFTLVRSLGTGT